MFARLMPFLGLGIALVLFVVALVFLSYIFIIGISIGFILYIIAWIRNKFTQSSANTIAQQTAQTKTTTHHQGNIYDHDEFK